MRTPGNDRRIGRVRVLGLVLVALLAVDIAPLFAQCADTTICASGVFCTAFEEANPKALWDDFDGNPSPDNVVMLDAGPCNTSGNHVMRLRAPAGGGQAADLVKVLPTTHDKLYARWYQKWEVGYDFSAGNHGGGLFAGDRSLLGSSGVRPNGSDWYTSWWETIAGTYSGQNLNGVPHLYTYYRGMYQQCIDPNGNCYGDSLPCMFDEGNGGAGYCTKPQHRETIMPPTIQSNRWYCIEVLLDGGTPTATATGANGAQDFWIDNVEFGPWTDLWHRITSTLKVNILWLNLYFGGTHSAEGVMVDDVVVSTQRIGCHGSTLPSKPTNLRVIPGVFAGMMY